VCARQDWGEEAVEEDGVEDAYPLLINSRIMDIAQTGCYL
jgi:hypothetical protein